MSQKIAKKIRQQNRRNWREYLRDVKELSLGVRIRLAWWIVFGKVRR